MCFESLIVMGHITIEREMCFEYILLLMHLPSRVTRVLSNLCIVLIHLSLERYICSDSIRVLQQFEVTYVLSR